MRQNLEDLLKIMIKTLINALCLSLSTLLEMGSANAQVTDWPYEKAITVVVPYTPGGATDTVTRLVMEQLSNRLGQNIVIENRPGANATIGTAHLARSAADGYHFATVIAAHSVNPHLYQLPYRDDDFATVTQMAELPMFLFVSNQLAVNSVDELIAYGKQQPLNFASSGTGSSAHMIGLHFAEMSGLKMNHIPYRGSAPILSDLLTGRVSLAFDPILVPMPYVKAGRLKVLALSAKSQWPNEPDIPLMTTLGYKDFDLSSWVALLSPKGTPSDIIERVSAEIAEILQDPEVQRKFALAGFIPKAHGPEALAELIAKDSAMYKEIIDKNNIRVD